MTGDKKKIAASELTKLVQTLEQFGKLIDQYTHGNQAELKSNFYLQLLQFVVAEPIGPTERQNLYENF